MKSKPIILAAVTGSAMLLVPLTATARHSSRSLVQPEDNSVTIETENEVETEHGVVQSAQTTTGTATDTTADSSTTTTPKTHVENEQEEENEHGVKSTSTPLTDATSTFDLQAAIDAAKALHPGVTIKKAEGKSHDRFRVEFADGSRYEFDGSGKVTSSKLKIKTVKTN